MKYKAILLDLDDTLYPYSQNHEIAIRESLGFLVKEFSISNQKAENIFLEARKQTAHQLPKTAASHNRLLYFQKMCEALNIKASLYALKLYNLYWDSFLANMKLSAGVKEFLSLCLEKKVKIALVTDLTAHIQYRKIERLEIGQYIDFVTTSEEIGFDKPHQEMFLKTINKLGIESNLVCMVGDNYEKDIIGASSLGIDSYWLNSNEEILKPQEKIKKFKNFKELKKLIFEVND